MQRRTVMNLTAVVTIFPLEKEWHTVSTGIASLHVRVGRFHLYVKIYTFIMRSYLPDVADSTRIQSERMQRQGEDT